MLAHRSWLSFRKGCKECDYKYDREPGYFWGASWIITYAVGSLSGLAIGASVFFYNPDIDSLLLAACAALPILPIAFLFHPYSRALWMWFDHYCHPLEEFEHYDDLEAPPPAWNETRGAQGQDTPTNASPPG